MTPEKLGAYWVSVYDLNFLVIRQFSLPDNLLSLPPQPEYSTRS